MSEREPLFSSSALSVPAPPRWAVFRYRGKRHYCCSVFPSLPPSTSSRACAAVRDELLTKTAEVEALAEKSLAASGESEKELNRLREEAEKERSQAERALSAKEEETAALQARYTVLVFLISVSILVAFSP